MTHTAEGIIKNNLIEYGTYITISRGIPDVRDGLKPVQRRILWSSYELNLKPDRGSYKCAKIVGHVIGSYNPHGDCLDKNAQLFALDGNPRTIPSLIESNTTQLEVLSRNKEGRLVPAIAHSFRIGQYATQVYNIHLSNNEVIRCSANHPFFVNGDWVKAEDLKPFHVIQHYHCEDKEIQTHLKFKAKLKTWFPDLHITKITIEELPTPEPLYDFTVDHHENALLVSGDDLLVTHNSSAYEALVAMANPWSIKYPLIQSVGNFGSIQGDRPAAYRYTEAGITELGFSHFHDKKYLSYVPNFDGKEKEPEVLSSLLPMTLVNGYSGIAMGFSGSIPSHHISDIASLSNAFLKSYPNPQPTPNPNPLPNPTPGNPQPNSLDENLEQDDHSPEYTETEKTFFKMLQGPQLENPCYCLSTPEEIEAIYRTGTGSITYACAYTLNPPDLAALGLEEFKVEKSSYLCVITGLCPGITYETIAKALQDLVDREMLELADFTSEEVRICITMKDPRLFETRVLPILIKAEHYQFHVIVP